MWQSVDLLDPMLLRPISTTAAHEKTRTRAVRLFDGRLVMFNSLAQSG